MLSQIAVTGLLVTTSLIAGCSAKAMAADLKIKQGPYVYQMPLTQNVSTETFLIRSTSSPVTTQKRPGDRGVVTTSVFAHFTHPLIVYFDFDSAEVGPDEKRQLLSELKGFELPEKTPLAVSGFTCHKGDKLYNDRLSNERAKRVAELLQIKGYTVAKIEGRGDADLVSEKNGTLNRRVEIALFHK